MNKLNKLHIVIIILVVSLVASLALTWQVHTHVPKTTPMTDQALKTDPYEDDSLEIDDSTAEPDTTTDTTKTPEATKPAAPNVTFARGHGYDKTLTNLQQSGYLAQFDACSTSPLKADQVVPKGVKFGVMNTGKVKTTYSLFGLTFKLGTGDYAVLSNKTPGVYSLRCEGQNRVKVTVAK